MPIHKPRQWDLPENLVTPESVYLSRRSLMKATLAWSALGVAGLGANIAGASKPTDFLIDPNLPITDQAYVFDYVNFYEFGSQKNVAPLTQAMQTNPWSLRVGGLVEQERLFDLDDLRKVMPMEERITRHRCVEAWAFVAPWQGFPLAALLAKVQPLPEAKYIKFKTLADEETMPGLAQVWYPWPYVEGLSIAEARNELAFLATGLYGKDLKPQNGAPIRLVLPWKYGFKSIKSIVSIELVAEQPVSFWEEVASSEYGFWANVNPDVPHRRWSQASHRMLGTNEREPTELYNGYGQWVAELYPDAKAAGRKFYY